MTAAKNMLGKVGSKVLAAMTKAGGAVKNVATKAKGGLLNLGNKIKNAGHTVATKVKGAGSTIANKTKNAGSKIASSKAVTNMKTGAKNFKTNFKTAYNTAHDKYSTKFAEVIKDTGTGSDKTGGGAGAGGQAYRNEITRGSVIAHVVSGIAMAGVAAYQVKSSNKQYKDAAAREDAYNKALQTKTNESDEEKAKTDAEYKAREDSYTAALGSLSTSSQNIYAGDSIFSSTLKNPRYTIF